MALEYLYILLYNDKSKYLKGEFSLKRFLSVLIILCVLASVCACAPKPQDVFKREANEFFDTGLSKGEETVSYNDKGSVAVSKPKLKDVNINTEISDYYKLLEDEFRLRAATDADKLFIGFSQYQPAEDIQSYRVVSTQTLGGATESTFKNFCYVNGEKFVPDRLFAKMLRIAIHDMTEGGIEGEPQLDMKGITDFDVTFLDDSVIADFEYEGKAKSFSLPYGDIHQVLPDSLKEKFPDSGKYPVDISKKLVAFTFDDGPHNTYSNKIMDTIEKYGVKATFFDVGTNIEYYPDIIKRGEALGCEMATHSWSHANLKTSSVDKIKSELDKADEAYKTVLGKGSKLMRPPYGAVGDNLKSVCDQYMIGWSVDTLDWKSRDKGAVVSAVKSERTLEGDVILMHSLYGSTSDAFAELVPWALENGYEPVTISELVKYFYEDDFEKGKYYSADFFDHRRMDRLEAEKD